ncbi:MAG: response regulator [Desulfobacterales bacterium]|jgi:two-component system response regulator YesN
MNILIIDPNILFQKSLKKLLVKNFPHVDVDVASDGREALNKIQGSGPQLIFLEVHLRGKSGFELADAIKFKHPEAIIALLTSYNFPEYQTAAKNAGIDHLIPKDEWTGEDIVALIRSIVLDQK